MRFILPEAIVPKPCSLARYRYPVGVPRITAVSRSFKYHVLELDIASHGSNGTTPMPNKGDGTCHFLLEQIYGYGRQIGIIRDWPKRTITSFETVILRRA